MGDHFIQFDYTPEQDCQLILPLQVTWFHVISCVTFNIWHIWQLLFDDGYDGIISGFVWQHFVMIDGLDSGRWEHPDSLAIMGIVDRFLELKMMKRQWMDDFKDLHNACGTRWTLRVWAPCTTTSGTTLCSSCALSSTREQSGDTGIWWLQSWKSRKFELLNLTSVKLLFLLNKLKVIDGRMMIRDERIFFSIDHFILHNRIEKLFSILEFADLAGIDKKPFKHRSVKIKRKYLTSSWAYRDLKFKYELHLNSHGEYQIIRHQSPFFHFVLYFHFRDCVTFCHLHLFCCNQEPSLKETFVLRLEIAS